MSPSPKRSSAPVPRGAFEDRAKANFLTAAPGLSRRRLCANPEVNFAETIAAFYRAVWIVEATYGLAGVGRAAHKAYPRVGSRLGFRSGRRPETVVDRIAPRRSRSHRRRALLSTAAI